MHLNDGSVQKVHYEEAMIRNEPVPRVSLLVLREVTPLACAKRGASIAETDKLRAKCGTARSELGWAPAPTNFCQSCGTPFAIRLQLRCLRLPPHSSYNITV
jgi:hypothetical protein